MAYENYNGNYNNIGNGNYNQGTIDASDIIRKYQQKLNSQLNLPNNPNYSKEYSKFKQEMSPELSRYEKWAKSLGNVLNLKIVEKDRTKVQKFLNIAHLDVTASQALGLAVMATFAVFFVAIMVVVGIYIINTSLQLLLGFLGVIASLFIFYYTYSMPQRLANAWRLQASAQMVPAILYVVVYMKHTSNLERAIQFASEHLEGPLALDFKKIFYDVEIGKFSTIKQSLENYLEEWRDYSPEFIESFHLIESSLFEPSEIRRVEILERSLQVILDGVYEKMLKYSREIRSPLTNLYMLGIILPTLGLALLPLASTLLAGALKWPHIFVIFNIIIPFFVFYMVSEVLLKRPGGYGETSALELNPNYQSYKSKKPWLKASLIAFPFLLLGILPLLLQLNLSSLGLNIQHDFTIEKIGIGFLGNVKAFDFQILENGKKVGPFGPLALILSMFIPLSFALFFSLAYSEKTKRLIGTRKDTKILETEFTNSLFQFGNRLGDGIPAEIAFGRVADSTTGQKSSEFFLIVSKNIEQGGMDVENAVFDQKRGAIIYFPSALIATSMRILVESVKKGLQVAARSLMSISEYVKNIEKINQRLRDLLAEIVSDMKSNMTFLAPLLAGIVVGLSGMITFILNKLGSLNLEGNGSNVSAFDIKSITSLLDPTNMIPPYFVQIAIGIYIVEVIFILTGALITVDAGRDPLREKFELSRNLKRGMFLYLVTALISTIALSVLAGFALANLG